MTFVQNLWRRNSAKMNKPGMTLIELLLVITVAAIVIGASLAIFRTVMNRAKLTKTQTMLRNVQSAIENFHTDTDEYPRNLEDLRRQPEGELGKRWTSQYLDKKPIDGWDHPLVYRPTPEAEHPYELYSFGSGGKKGKSKIDVWNL